MLKAYNTYPGESPHYEGCILVFAKDRNEAKSIGCNEGPWLEAVYIEMNARRVKHFDKYAKGETAYHVETNDDLPEPFFDAEI